MWRRNGDYQPSFSYAPDPIYHQAERVVGPVLVTTVERLLLADLRRSQCEP